MIYRFGKFEIDEEDLRLRADGVAISLEPKSFQILLLLVRSRGRVVKKSELLDTVWKDTSVTEGALTRCIGLLRKALEDDRREPRFIETVPTLGFRFIPVVTTSEPESPSPTLYTIPEASGTRVTSSLPKLWMVSLTGIVLFLVTFAVARSLRRAHDPHIRSIAVLPLRSLSNDVDQDYLAQGITEELTTDLAYAKSLRVVSRASTRGFKNSALAVPEIARRLNVDAVIEGTVLRVDHTIRVTVRLTGASPEKQIWAASFERDAGDLILLEDQIAAEAVSQIQDQLAPEQRVRLSAKERVAPEAYDEYLRGRFFLEQETGQKDKAIPHLERAIQIDPHFAGAYAALGEAWNMQGVWVGLGNREASAKALAYAEHAVTLDPNSSESFASLGQALMQAHRWNEGEIALRKAVALDPNNPYALEYLALVLVQQGRLDDSLRLSRDLAVKEPVSIEFQRAYAEMLYRARRYDEAIAQCQRVLEMDPNHLATYTTLGNSYVEEGHFPQAENAFTEGHFMNAGLRAWLDVRAGDKSNAKEILRKNPTLINVHTAVARYLLGDRTAGLAELEDLTNRQWAIKTYHLRNDPTFDPMRSDPGFIAIERKSGLLNN